MNKETPWKYPDPIYKPKEEDELETQLMKCLKENGWKAERQVICEETKHWKHPWTADIICEKPSQGISHIGIELKYFKHTKSGSNVCKTFKQIWKYYNKTFNDSKIDMWVFGIYFKEPGLKDSKNFTDDVKKNNEEYHNLTSCGAKAVISGFFNNAGFGFLDLNDSYLKIIFSGQGNNNHKITVYNPYKETKFKTRKEYSGNNNFNEIRKKCLEKQREFIKYIPRVIK